MAKHPCCRAMLKFFSAITIIVGLVSLGFGIYGMIVSKNQFWSNIGSNIFQIGSAFLIALGVLIGIIGAFGYLGTQKSLRCCIGTYSFGIIVFFLIFLTLGIAVVWIQHNELGTMEDQLDALKTNPNSNCGDNSFLSFVNESNQVVLTAYSNFGNVSGCPAYIYNETVQTMALANHLQYYSNTSNASLSVNVIDAQCTYTEKTSKNFSGYSLLMQFLEKEYNCTGMCTQVDYFLFNDVNYVKKTQDTSLTCYQSIYNFFETDGDLVWIVSFAIAAYLALNILFSCTLCCGRKEDSESGQSGTVYKKMIDAYIVDD